MKYEYHLTISRTDRMWLIAFALVLLAWELIKPILDSPSNMLSPSIFDTTMTDSIESQPVSEKLDFRKPDPTTQMVATTDQEDITEPLMIGDATFDQLQQIGFSSKVSSNILKYIEAGGKIESNEDLSRIYGMDSQQLKTALPYLVFPEKNDKPIYDFQKKPATEKPVIIFDINAVTASELESLPGIGTVLAERIIKYRTSLGGFIDLSQLKEIYGIPVETLDKILPRLAIITPHQTFAINSINLADFYHPYLDKKKARIVDSYLKQHGPAGTQEDLKKMYPPDTNWYRNVLPYLRFE